MSNQLIILLSVLSFLVSVYLLGRVRGLIIIKTIWFSLAFVNILFFGFFNFVRYFSDHGIDNAVIFHYKYGIMGAGLSEYLKPVILSLLLIFCLLILVYSFLWKIRIKKYDHKSFPCLALLFILISLFLNPLLFIIWL